MILNDIHIGAVVYVRPFANNRLKTQPLFVVQSTPFRKNNKWYVKVRRWCGIKYPLSRIEEDRMLSSLVMTGETYVKTSSVQKINDMARSG